MVLPEWMPAPDSVPFHFLFAAVGAVIPIFNPEIALLSSASLVTDTPHLMVMAAAAAVGEMCGKTFLFGVARKSGEFIERNPKRKAVVDRARARLSVGPLKQVGALSLSACLGFPPFYGVALAAGALRLNPFLFFGSGLAGRYVRFLICVFMPSAAHHLVRP